MGTVDTIQIPVFEQDGPDYEADFCAWSGEQARRLRLLRVPGLDVENLAEEIESLSRSDRRALASHIRVLLAHLLKQRYQPELAGRSWQATVDVQREAACDLLADSPSLRPLLDQVVQRQYGRAVADAAAETGLSADRFPAACEWTADQVLASPR